MTYQIDFSNILTMEYMVRIARGILLTVELGICAWLIAAVMGVLLTILRMTPSRLLQAAVAVFVEVHQNIPLLVQIFFWYFAIPELLPADVTAAINAANGEFIFAVCAIGFCFSAYVSEALRSGIRAIPIVQYESGRALGFSFLSTFRYIVAPEATRLALPSLTNITLLLFKNTSLAAAIGVNELTSVSRSIESSTFRTFEIFTIATTLYLIMSAAIVVIGWKLEKSMRDAVERGAGR